eukprot:2653368-Pleurochrysis_carterae.AAC.1
MSGVLTSQERQGHERQTETRRDEQRRVLLGACAERTLRKRARAVCSGKAEIRGLRGQQGVQGCTRRLSLARSLAVRLYGGRARSHRVAPVRGWDRCRGGPARVHDRALGGVRRQASRASRRNVRRRMWSKEVMPLRLRSDLPHISRVGVCIRNPAGGCELHLHRARRPSRCCQTRTPYATEKQRYSPPERLVRRTATGRAATSEQVLEISSVRLRVNGGCLGRLRR